MLTFNNKILTVSNKGLEVEAGPTPPGPTPSLPFDYVQIGDKLWSLDIQVNDGGEGVALVNVGTVGIPGQQIDLGNRYYYTPAAASRIATAIAAEFPGWHIPSKIECMSLEDSATAVDLRATNGWGVEGSSSPQGTNTTGFTAYATAYAYTDTTTPVISSDKGAYYQFIAANGYTWYINPEFLGMGSQSSGLYYSFRLVKDV